MSGIKRTAADAAFSTCVRERSDWTCELCGKQYPEGNRQGLHCSHYIGRRNMATRFEPLNAMALCYGCHSKVGGDPPYHTAIVEERLGDLYEVLLEKKRMIVPKADRQDREVAKWFRLQHKAMREKRMAGVTGRIEFQGWL